MRGHVQPTGHDPAASETLVGVSPALAPPPARQANVFQVPGSPLILYITHTFCWPPNQGSLQFSVAPLRDTPVACGGMVPGIARISHCPPPAVCSRGVFAPEVIVVNWPAM